MNFKERYLKLLELDILYENLTFDSEYIWPYIRNKIYGQIHSEYIESSNTKIFKKKTVYTDESREISNIIGSFDSLLVRFNRTIQKDSKIVDPILESIKNYPIGNYIELEYIHEGYPIDTEVYNMNLAHQIYNSKKKINNTSNFRETSIDISRKLEMNFDIDKYIPEISNMCYVYHNYLRKVFTQLRIKRIFLTSNYMRQPFMIVALEMGIDVYDIQYAEYSDYHNGYHINNQNYKFAPTYLVSNRQVIKRPNYFAKNIKAIYSITDIETENVVTKNTKKEPSFEMLIISQNLVSGVIDKVVFNYASATNKKILYRPHPNDNIANIKSLELDNVTLDDRDLEISMEDSKYIVGMGSSVIAQAIKDNRNVIVIEGYLKYFIEYYILKYNIPVVEELSQHTFDKQELRNIEYHKFAELSISENRSEATRIIKRPFQIEMEKIKRKAIVYKNLMPIAFSYTPLTIIIPAYNAGEKLFLNNWLQLTSEVRTFANVIIVNDASTDDSVLYLNMFEEYSHIKVIHLKQNMGNPSDVRNVAMECLQTDYVTFLDADDTYIHNTLKRMLSVMIYYGVDMIRANNLVLTENGIGQYTTTDKNEILSSRQIQKSSKLNTDHTFLWNMIIKTKYVKDFKLIDGIGEDLNFNTYVLKKVRNILLFTEDILVYDNQNADSFSSTISEKKLLRTLHLLKETLEISKFKKELISKVLISNIINKYNILEYDEEVSKVVIEIFDKYYKDREFLRDGDFTQYYSELDVIGITKFAENTIHFKRLINNKVNGELTINGNVYSDTYDARNETVIVVEDENLNPIKIKPFYLRQIYEDGMLNILKCDELYLSHMFHKANRKPVNISIVEKPHLGILVKTNYEIQKKIQINEYTVKNGEVLDGELFSFDDFRVYIDGVETEVEYSTSYMNGHMWLLTGSKFSYSILKKDIKTIKLEEIFLENNRVFVKFANDFDRCKFTLNNRDISNEIKTISLNVEGKRYSVRLDEKKVKVEYFPLRTLIGRNKIFSVYWVKGDIKFFKYEKKVNQIVACELSTDLVKLHIFRNEKIEYVKIKMGERKYVGTLNNEFSWKRENSVIFLESIEGYVTMQEVGK